MSFDPARDDSDLPDVDDRLVEPGTRYEMLDGELVYVPPCDEPHGERHSQLCALLGAHAGAEFKVAADMLTRTSKIDDIAPDASIYPAARHPKTGRRQLDHLSFELVSTETLGYSARKAAKLAGRGVRRVFAIDIERSRALEWSVALGAWSVLDAAGHIVDPALAVPLPIKALIHSMKADDTIARALIAKCNPVIAANDAEARAEGKAQGKLEGRLEGLAQGQAEGLARAVIAVLANRGVALDPAERDRILGERDLAQLERWLVRSTSCATAAELLLAP
jgi:hypothetical protein